MLPHCKKYTHHDQDLTFYTVLLRRNSCILQLHVIDHGAPGVQEASPGDITRADVDAICPYLCPGAGVKLWGCSVGANGPIGVIRWFLNCRNVDRVVACDETVGHTSPNGWGMCYRRGLCDGNWHTFRRDSTGISDLFEITQNVGGLTYLNILDVWVSQGVSAF
jgi:hypothetical protein